MKNIKNNKIKFFSYKKWFFSIFFLLFLLFPICILVINKKLIQEKKMYTIEKFKNVANFLKEKKRNIYKEEKLFFEKNKNIYGSLIGMKVAKKYFIKKKYELSIKTLNQILKNIKEENLICFVKLNLVKIYIQKKDFFSALKIIKSIKNDSWKTIFNNYKFFYLYK